MIFKLPQLPNFSPNAPAAQLIAAHPRLKKKTTKAFLKMKTIFHAMYVNIPYIVVPDA
jgi:hypothetical protein